MKKLLLAAAFLACSLAGWAFGYKVRIDSPSTGVLFFVDESKLNPESAERGLLIAQGVTEYVFHDSAEYMVLLVQVEEAGLIRVDIILLDERDEPLPRKPIRVSGEGRFLGLRVRHPHWGVDRGV